MRCSSGHSRAESERRSPTPGEPIRMRTCRAQRLVCAGTRSSSASTSEKCWSTTAADAACRTSAVPLPPSWLGPSVMLAAVPEDGRREEIDMAENVGTSLRPLGGSRIRVQVQQASEAYWPGERIGQPIAGTELLEDPSFLEPGGEQLGGIVGGA